MRTVDAGWLNSGDLELVVEFDAPFDSGVDARVRGLLHEVQHSQRSTIITLLPVPGYEGSGRGSQDFEVGHDAEVWVNVCQSARIGSGA